MNLADHMTDVYDERAAAEEQARNVEKTTMMFEAVLRDLEYTLGKPKAAQILRVLGESHGLLADQPDVNPALLPGVGPIDPTKRATNPQILELVTEFEAGVPEHFRGNVYHKEWLAEYSLAPKNYFGAPLWGSPDALAMGNRDMQRAERVYFNVIAPLVTTTGSVTVPADIASYWAAAESNWTDNDYVQIPESGYTAAGSGSGLAAPTAFANSYRQYFTTDREPGVRAAFDLVRSRTY